MVHFRGSGLSSAGAPAIPITYSFMVIPTNYLEGHGDLVMDSPQSSFDLLYFAPTATFLSLMMEKKIDITIMGLYRVVIGIVEETMETTTMGLYRVIIGMMEKKMEMTIMGLHTTTGAYPS